MLRRSTITLLALGSVAQGFQIRGYDPAVHRRFNPLPPSPQTNPGGLYAAYDLSGIGWRPASPEIQMALISRQHVLFATHFQGVAVAGLSFLGSGNVVHTRNVASKGAVIQNGQPSDLLLVTLDAPIPASSGVKPLAYLDLGTYTGVEIGVAGFREEAPLKFAVIGRDTITAVAPTALPGEPGSGLEAFTTRTFSFTYRTIPNGGSTQDEGYFQIGDSGSPTFGISNSGEAALVGVHSSLTADTNGPNTTYTNHDVFVPHYVNEINASIGPAGYRFTPANEPATTTSVSASTITAIPRQGHPLLASITVSNTGSALTGNVEVDLAPSPAATAIAAPGWVSYAGGLTQRQATLAAGTTAAIEVQWAAAPLNATSAALPYAWRSDKGGSGSSTLTIPLAPSYAAWAQGLAQPGQSDDPDFDGQSNLIEYAFGGNPQSPELILAPGVPMLPTSSADATDFELRFPVRDDALLRGLTYDIEFSSGLGSWSTNPPAGLVVSDQALNPDVPGFEIRRARWPLDSDIRFARVRIILNE